ncbi:MAG: hypothetical protein ACTSYN_04665 [Candidatus Heimdallarchaeaceae archaeon]
MKKSVENAISELKGTSLKVFLYALKQKNEIGIRETQRILKLKTVSLAQYHLQRLYTLGLLEKTAENKYTLSKECADLRNLKFNIILEFFVFRNWFIPTVSLLATFLITSTGFTILLYFAVSVEAAVYYSIGALFIAGIIAALRGYQIIITLKKD